MLKFKNEYIYMDKIIELDSLLETHDDYFLSLYPVGLSGLQYDSIEQNTNYDEYLPLRQFEQNIGFNNSLLNKFIYLENEWMADTSKMHPFEELEFDGSELSLVNNKQRWMIGDTIYQLNSTSLYKITSNYNQILVSIDNSLALEENENLKILSFGNPNCEMYRKASETVWEQYDFDIKGTLSVNVKIKFRGLFGAPTRAKASMKSYITRIVDGKRETKLYRRMMTLAVEKRAYKDGQCNKLAIQGTKSKGKYKLKNFRYVEFYSWKIGTKRTFNANSNTSLATKGHYYYGKSTPIGGPNHTFPLGW